MSEQKGSVRAVCISARRGIKKISVPEGFLKADYGIEGDAHAGRDHRQVSFLSAEDFDAFKMRKPDLCYGDFGENFILEGVDFFGICVGSRLQIGQAVVEVTQIGKECSSPCSIAEAVGVCIMPSKGVFARVVSSGRVSVQGSAALLS